MNTPTFCALWAKRSTWSFTNEPTEHIQQIVFNEINSYKYYVNIPTNSVLMNYLGVFSETGDIVTHCYYFY